MKCPNSKCNYTGIQPAYKFCPKCKTPLTLNNNNTVSTPKEKVPFTSMADYSNSGDSTISSKGLFSSLFGSQSVESSNYKRDLEVVKGKVIWQLEQGLIARRIDIAEFEHLDGVKGIYIQEGTSAVLFIDGEEIMTLQSGIYYKAGFLDRLVHAGKAVWGFFAGRRDGETDQEHESRRNRLSIAMQRMKGNSVIEVILKRDGHIPMLLDAVTDKDGNLQFKPFLIKTKLSDIEVGVSMHLQISNFKLFRVNYLMDQKCYKISDLQLTLRDVCRNTFQSVLANADIQSHVMPDQYDAAIRRNLRERISDVLYGVDVVQILDIVMSNQDFERFRELQRKLQNSAQELEFLTRTNTFKNRLQSEKNKEIIQEARTEEELRYALQQLNKDALLHDDEIEAFGIMLSAQKVIRNAQSEEDVQKALQDILKSKLLREDEFNELEYELKHNRDKRQEIDTLMYWASVCKTENARIGVEKEITINQINAEKDIEGVQYEANKQRQGHINILEKEQQHHTHGLESNQVDHDLNQRKKIDTYLDSRDDIELEKDLKATKAWQQVAKNAANDSLDIKERDGDIKIREEERRVKIERDNIQQLFDNELAKTKLFNEHDLAKLKLTTEQEVALIKAQAGMTSEEITALHLKDLSDDAQVAFAQALSSNREIEWTRIQADEKVKMMQQMVEYAKEKDATTQATQTDMMNKMTEMMKEFLHANAQVASSATMGAQWQAQQQLAAQERIAKHRMSELETDRQEARAERNHAQQRMDHNTDTAMHYTAKVSASENMAGATTGNVFVNQQFVSAKKCPECGTLNESENEFCINCGRTL